MNNTILLNSYLFGVIVLLNIILKIGKVSIIKLNYKNYETSKHNISLLFVYEYLFFRNVIYNYVPNSSNKIVKKKYLKKKMCLIVFSYYITRNINFRYFSIIGMSFPNISLDMTTAFSKSV